MTFQLLCSPGFGADLCAAFAGAPDALIEPLHSFHDPSRWPRAEVQIVASDREETRAFEICDMVAWALGRPWMPVVLEPRSIRIGPLVRPESACYQCFQRRQQQLGHRTTVDEEMERFGSQPHTGGYLPAHVDLAASLARRLIDLAQSRKSTVDMYRVGLSEIRVTSAVLTPVDGCARCTRLRSYRETGDIRWSLLESPRPATLVTSALDSTAIVK